jgi:replicative DNA helicase
MTTGFINGDLIVIAARPSKGKTALAMNIAECIAIDQKLPVGVFSLEMTKESLVDRMVCSRARVNIRNIKEGFFSERDFPKITNAAGKLANSNLWINDIGGLSILQLRAKARLMFQRYGIRFLVVDFLQLLHSKSKQAQGSREREIAEIAEGLKGLGKELGIPVLALCQLNRKVDEMKGVQRPNMSHLRESGAIEQAADLIGLLYKATSDKDDETIRYEQDAVPMALDIAKQRNGATGTVNLTFLKPYTRFESAAKISADDLPDDQHVLGPRD